MNNKQIEEAVRLIVESCDSTGTMDEATKDELCTKKLQEINGAIADARADGIREGVEQGRKETAVIVREAEENAFKRGVDAGVDQASDEVDSQGEQYYEFIVELIREIDTLQKLMIKIARAESYLEGYNKGREEAGAGADVKKDDTEGGIADGIADNGDVEGQQTSDGTAEANSDDNKEDSVTEKAVAEKYRSGSKLLVEAVSKYLDGKIAEYLTESVVVDRGELERLRMVVESIRNNVVVGDERVTEYITKVDRTRRQEVMESRQEAERLRKENLILESTNKRLEAKNLLMEKTESLPAFERRQMRDAFRGCDDMNVITESFDEKFKEMKRSVARDTSAKLARRPIVGSMVNESIDQAKRVASGDETLERVDESEKSPVAGVVKEAAAAISRYSKH